MARRFGFSKPVTTSFPSSKQTTEFSVRPYNFPSGPKAISPEIPEGFSSRIFPVAASQTSILCTLMAAVFGSPPMYCNAAIPYNRQRFKSTVRPPRSARMPQARPVCSFHWETIRKRTARVSYSFPKSTTPSM